MPLLERLRFPCIVSSNLDEFFEIRVSASRSRSRIGSRKSGEDGIAPVELARARQRRGAPEIISSSTSLLNGDILPALERKAWSSCAAALVDRGPARVDPRLLHARGHAGADPDRAGPGASLPTRAQQELELRRRARRPRRLRARLGARRSCRRRALPRAIRLPRELCDQEYGFVFLSSVLHAHGRAVPA